MSNATETRIPCSRETRDLVKRQKRAGQRYEDVLRRMAEQYDPTEAAGHTTDNKD